MNLDATMWSWAAMAGLGLFHGINPGMGWLFAVALGMQERCSRAVWRAMAPLALGHGLAIGVAVGAALLIGAALPPRLLIWPVAALLIGMGAYRFLRCRHPRWAAMRVGPGRLTLWSFLMASAHGAGLMVLPFFLGIAVPAEAAHCHAGGHLHGGWTALAATGVHSAGYLVMTAAAAVLVYRKFGLRLLREKWVNLDLIWSAALVLTGFLTLLL